MWWIFSNFWRHLGRSVRTEEGNIVDIVGIPLCHRHNVGCKEHLWDEFCDFQKTYRKTLIELCLNWFDIWGQLIVGNPHECQADTEKDKWIIEENKLPMQLHPQWNFSFCVSSTKESTLFCGHGHIYKGRLQEM